MSKSQRTKGAGGEREVCALLTEEFGRKACRELAQTRDGGYDIPYDPFHIEVKRRKRIANLYEWLEQADSDPTLLSTKLAAVPTLFLRADGEGWLVVMRFRDWAKLARGEIE